MRKILLLMSVAAFCGCGGHRTRFVPGGDSGPVTPPRVDPPVTVAHEESRPVPRATPDPAPPLVEETVPPVEPLRRSAEETIKVVNGQLGDVYFGYDQSDLAPDAVAALQHDAALLQTILHDFPALRVTVEGHCDERGSAEYNLGLGDRRAVRTVNYLLKLGLPAVNFQPVSYGKEAPQCVDSTEACWRRNRRAHFVVREAPTE